MNNFSTNTHTQCFQYIYETQNPNTEDCLFSTSLSLLLTKEYSLITHYIEESTTSFFVKNGCFSIVAHSNYTESSTLAMIMTEYKERPSKYSEKGFKILMA